MTASVPSPATTVASLERALVATMFHNASVRARILRQIDARHFFDLEALRIFRLYADGGVLTSLPFTESPLQEKEIDSAIAQIKDAAWLREVNLHGQHLVSLSQRGEKSELLKVLARPPLIVSSDSHVDPRQGNAELLMQIATGQMEYVAPNTPQLAPLNLMFLPTTITNISARPSVGKSSLGEQIAVDLTNQGVWFLDISVELGGTLRVQRYHQHLGGPDFSPDAYAKTRFDPSRLQEVLKNYENVTLDTGVIKRPLTIDVSSFSLPDVLQSIRGFKQKFDAAQAEAKRHGSFIPGPPVVMVDYLQLVSVPGANDEIYKKVNAICTALYEITKELKIAMVWISQFKKEDTKSKVFQPDRLPDADDIEGGAIINNLASTMLFLHRPAEAWTAKGWKKTIAYTTKARYGENYRIEGAYNGEHLSFNFDAASLATAI